MPKFTDPTPCLIMFDLDGTVLHLTEAENGSYIQALEAMAGRPVNTDWSSYPVRSDLAIARAALSAAWGRPCTDADLAEFLRSYVGLLDGVLASSAFAPQFVAGAEATLAMLAALGHVRLGLATANARAAAERRLQGAGLGSAFPACAFAEDGATKTEILKSAMTRAAAGARPGLIGLTIFIGDQPSDVAAARANQVEFVGVAPSARDELRLGDAGCGRLVSDLSREGGFQAHLEAIGVLNPVAVA